MLIRETSIYLKAYGERERFWHMEGTVEHDMAGAVLMGCVRPSTCQPRYDMAGQRSKWAILTWHDGLHMFRKGFKGKWTEK